MKNEKYEKVDKQRLMTVNKSNEMVRKGREYLSQSEMKFILYLISKIKPTDKEFSQFEIDLKEFNLVCGCEKNSDSFSRLKKQIEDIQKKGWWYSDVDEKGKKVERFVTWFDNKSLVLYNDTSKVKIAFDDRIKKHLLNLSNDINSIFHITYELQNVLPMKYKYSIRLYELLKTYSNSKKSTQWTFEIEDLKEHLIDKNTLKGNTYKNFSHFQSKILDKAISEINIYTNINVRYDIEKEGKKVSKVIFYITCKKTKETSNAFNIGVTELDGESRQIIAAKEKDFTEREVCTELYDGINPIKIKVKCYGDIDEYDDNDKNTDIYLIAEITNFEFRKTYIEKLLQICEPLKTVSDVDIVDLLESQYLKFNTECYNRVNQAIDEWDNEHNPIGNRKAYFKEIIANYVENYVNMNK